MKRDIFLSVIMPGYNEGEKIRENLGKVSELLEDLVTQYEIVFVNDGSSDDTSTQAHEAQLQNDNITVIDLTENQGKGNALKLGTAKAKGQYVMFLDSDLDLSPVTIKDFLAIMEKTGADVVIGSKLHPDSQIHYPAVRRFVSFCYYLFLLVLFRLNVRDTQTGMKLFKADVIKPVMEKILVKRFAFDIEVLSIINRKHYKIADAPVILEYGRTTRWGRITIRDILNVFIDTLAIFYRLYLLKYYD